MKLYFVQEELFSIEPDEIPDPDKRVPKWTSVHLHEETENALGEADFLL